MSLVVRIVRTAMLVLAVVTWVRPARALAAEPARLPDTELEGSSGQTHRLADYLGRVLVVFYEDRNSSHQNAALKQAMRDRARSSDLGKHVTFLPIADLDGYGFFAVKPFARSAVRSMAEKFGIEILMDWSGELAKALGLVPEQSNVLILDRSGKVVFRSSGALGPEDRSRFFDALDKAVAS